MAAVICELGMAKIIELCSKKGLSHFEVVEAALMNCLHPFQNPLVVDIMNVRLSLVEEERGLDINVKAVENYLLNLPGELTGVVAELVKLSVFNVPRSESNWQIVEAVMCANDPAVAKEVSKRDGGNETRH